MIGGFTRHVPATDQSGWLAVGGGGFLAVVPRQTVTPVVDALWRLAHEPAVSIEAIVGAIPLAGDGAVDAFAVVAFAQRDGSAGTVTGQATTGGTVAAGTASASTVTDCTISAVVRGDACIDVYSVGGSRRFSAGDVSPWLLADFRSVTSVVVGTVRHPPGAFTDSLGGSLPIDVGVVVADRLCWSLTRQRVPETVPTTALDAGSVQDTIVRPRAAVRLPQPVTAAPIVDAGARTNGAAGTNGDNGDTILLRRWPALPAEPGAGETASRPAGDAPRRTYRRFRVGDAPSHPLDVPALVGRKPHPPRIATGAPPRLITVPSPGHEVSGTHLRIAQEAEAVVVTDLRSMNGTIVILPGLERVKLRPGDSRVVVAGTRIDIGDGNIIEILSEADSV